MASSSIPMTPAQAAVPRQAASIILLRDGARGLETLMLRRHSRSGFAASAWVFPGGVVDAMDAQVDAGNWSGIDPSALAPVFDLTPPQVLAIHVAAVRETFEEAGVLLAQRRDGTRVDVAAPAFAEIRHALNDREVSVDWPGFLRREGLVLDLGAVAYFSRWITPFQEPRRYDTFFFAARMPAGAIAAADTVETTQDRWITPQDALAEEEFRLIFPTIKTLGALDHLGSVDAILDKARTQSVVSITQPHILVDDDGRYTRILLPTDEGYPHELYASYG
ncbi:MAG: NUDIX hydrolase [Euzebya sp.]